MKKEFIGPGLHLRPVCADPARPPLQWTLNSVLSACGNDNGRIRPPLGRGILKITSRLRENRHESPLPLDCIYRKVTSGLLIIDCLECNLRLIDY